MGLKSQLTTTYEERMILNNEVHPLMVPVTRCLLSLAALSALTGLAAYGQSVISAHSGVLHVSDGAVFLADQPVNQKFGTFPDIKEKMVLRTEAGRAEVLLTPGVFLRIGENSSIKMIDNRLVDTRVEFLGGSAVVEADDPMKENAVTVVYKDFQVHVQKSSVIEFQGNPEQLKVYHGEAQVELNGAVTTVKAGGMMPFTAALAKEHFDARKDGDELTRWSERRSGDLAVANVSAAKTLRDSGASWNQSGWYYNPFYSMYTYIPFNGMFMSPYGYGFFSPYSVYQAYYPGYWGGYGYGYGGYGYGNGGGGGGTPTAFASRPRTGFTGSGTVANPTQPSFGRTASSTGYNAPSYSAPVSSSGPSFGGSSGMSSGASTGGGGHAGGASGGRAK
jgi:hypothetical protein